MATARRRRATRGRAHNKILISIRLHPATVAAYRATGKGWQTRMSAVLDDQIARARAIRKGGADA